MADVSKICRGFDFGVWANCSGQESGLFGLGFVWQGQESGLGVRPVFGFAYVRFFGVRGGLDG